jgi:hypothetical protein
MRIFGPRGDVPTLTCLMCGAPMAPHDPVVYLYSGAVVHVPCRRSSSGAASPMVATIQPSTPATPLGARARHLGDRALVRRAG